MTVLASPADTGPTQRLPADVLSPTLVSHAPEHTVAARLEAWLANLALVRPGRADAGASSMVLFVALAPVGRHSVGLQAIGSF